MASSLPDQCCFENLYMVVRSIDDKNVLRRNVHIQKLGIPQVTPNPTANDRKSEEKDDFASSKDERNLPY